jgi:1,5-anhydro-D-fructose reductase (1,5-anhydro-D-mannitol-forming)
MGRRIARLRWGIVGTGSMADQVATAIDRSPSDELAGVVSRTQGRAAAFGLRHRIQATYPSIEALLESGSTDAVYVGSPNGLHRQHALNAIAAGQHVLCDKPLALTVPDAERIRAAAAKAGVCLGTVFQTRFHPAARRIHTLIASGRIGRLEFIRASIGFGPEELTGWRAEPGLAGAGALNNLGIHAIDITRYLVGAEVELVTSIVVPAGGQALDRTALAALRFENGVLADLKVSQELGLEEVRIELLGSTARIDWTGWLAPYLSGRVTLRSGGYSTGWPSACPDAYGRLVRAFSLAVRSSREPNPSADDAVEAVRIVEAVLTSGATGRAVHLRR